MRYVLITLGVVLLIIFGVVIFNRGGSKTPSTTKKAPSLTDYANSSTASVQYVLNGPINASENHRTTRIIINSTSRSLTVYSGYQNHVLGNQTLPNDPAAFQAFLAALNQASFTKTKVVPPAVSQDSICPTSTRTHYLIVDGTKNVMDSWSASCTSGVSYGGNTSLTATLFQTQIPDYNRFVLQFQPPSQ